MTGPAEALQVCAIVGAAIAALDDVVHHPGSPATAGPTDRRRCCQASLRYGTFRASSRAWLPLTR
jgi:hypothetical protein